MPGPGRAIERQRDLHRLGAAHRSRRGTQTAKCRFGLVAAESARGHPCNRRAQLQRWRSSNGLRPERSSMRSGVPISRKWSRKRPSR